MKRDIYQSLINWKKSDTRKPLILQGARQVGKTYILKEFGKNEYEDTAYFNFEENPALKEFFTGRISPEKIIEKLSIYREKSILPGKTLIIFDEVQNSPETLTSLKYFQEEGGQYHIAAAGSLTKAVQLCRIAAPHAAKIEVEAKTMAEVREACRAGAGVILLDNMTPAQVRAALMIIAGSAIVEVSGGVRFETLRDYALQGVDVISIGALTHSALSVDLSLDIRTTRRNRR